MDYVRLKLTSIIVKLLEFLVPGVSRKELVVESPDGQPALRADCHVAGEGGGCGGSRRWQVQRWGRHGKERYKEECSRRWQVHMWGRQGKAGEGRRCVTGDGRFLRGETTVSDDVGVTGGAEGEVTLAVRGQAQGREHLQASI